ncbi:MAG: DNA polymerase/3'-5' exonuclease PolX [Alphaproteobacteria bacterium]
MPVSNSDIAALFNRLAELLEIEGANPFRVRAYRNAARVIDELPQSAASFLAEGKDLAELPGIGGDLAAKIEEIVRTGRLKALEAVEREVPEGLVELSDVPGLGPKRVKALYERLKIRSRRDLAKAVAAGKLHGLKGFGPKLEERIGRELGRATAPSKRTLLSVAEDVGEPLLEYLKATRGVRAAAIAGSYRRRKDTVGDLDILVACDDSAEVMGRFLAYDGVRDVLARGATRSAVVLRSGLQVDLRAVPEESFGAALHYFTGSKAHNIAVRALAVKRGWKLNEYGLFKGEKRLAGQTESEVYERMGLRYIEPELREDQGEIDASRGGTLPALIELADLKGDLHVHTDASDGRSTLSEMAAAAKAKGYAYLGISDHSRRVTIAHGLDTRRLGRQIDAIDRLNGRLRGIEILKSVEVDVLDDGSLDLPDSILKELDYVVCAVHSKFSLPLRAQTERIIRAMDNRYVTIFAHPTGRLLNERPPYDVDMERIIDAARQRGCALELNAQPERLDLMDIHCRMAKEAGVKIALSSDAHSAAGLDLMRFGIGQARRGWLEAGDVLNTRPWKEVRALLRRG